MAAYNFAKVNAWVRFPLSALTYGVVMARSENSGGMFRYTCKNNPRCEMIFIGNKRTVALEAKNKHEKKCSK